jgi:hypothetical protein
MAPKRPSSRWKPVVSWQQQMTNFDGYPQQPCWVLLEAASKPAAIFRRQSLAIRYWCDQLGAHNRMTAAIPTVSSKLQLEESAVRESSNTCAPTFRRRALDGRSLIGFAGAPHVAPAEGRWRCAHKRCRDNFFSSSTFSSTSTTSQGTAATDVSQLRLFSLSSDDALPWLNVRRAQV